MFAWPVKVIIQIFKKYSLKNNVIMIHNLREATEAVESIVN